MCMKIGIIGAGYVGLSLATMLSLDHEVMIYDILIEKVHLINERKSPIEDQEITYFFKNYDLNLTASSNLKLVCMEASYIIVATPTPFNFETNCIDTRIIEDNIEKILILNDTSTIVIKSTVPVNFTKDIKGKMKIKNIIVCPEFLREGSALYDCLHPSRIVIGGDLEIASHFAEILVKSSEEKEVPVFIMDSSEAEAAKLFSNAYLAMRVAFFNELDTFAIQHNLKTQPIINSISCDYRIGDYYNNPSFGYGGYCLPKDTRELSASFQSNQGILINSIIKSNEIRKNFLVRQILNTSARVVGIYRLVMKMKSDNFRESAVVSIIEKLIKSGVEVLIYEPLWNMSEYKGAKLVKDINRFKDKSNIIIANRVTDELEEVLEKVYSRDIFNRD